MKRALLLLVPLALACDGEIYREDPKGPAAPHMHNHPEPPPPYAGLTNPHAGEELEVAITAGEVLYQRHCMTCHGRGARGDGPAGRDLDPPAADLVEHGEGATDAYWFWRIREGGKVAPFASEMPAWKDELSEEETWQVLSYVKSLVPDADTDMHVDEAPHGDAGADSDAHIDEAPHT